MWAVEHMDLSIPDDRHPRAFALFNRRAKRDEKCFDVAPSNRPGYRAGEDGGKRSGVPPLEV